MNLLVIPSLIFAENIPTRVKHKHQKVDKYHKLSARIYIPKEHVHDLIVCSCTTI